jgi:hypothetical protein
MIKILLAVPTTGRPFGPFADSLAKMCVYIEREIGQVEPMFIEGSSISGNRETAVRHLLSNQYYTHLLFIDEDMHFNPTIISSLTERNLPVVGVNYRRRGPPYTFVAMGLDGNEVITSDNSPSIEQVAFTGFGFCLLKREVLEAIEFPRFPVAICKETESYSTEDTTFFMKVAELGVEIYVDHDASKQVHHVGTAFYGYDFIISTKKA